MKIAFLSNFYNHHQSFISRELYSLTNGEYRFIATMPVPAERRKLGYQENTDPFVLHYGSNAEVSKLAQEWIESADVLILGSASEELLEERKKSGKLILRYSEHLLKKGFQWWKWPVRFFRFHKNNPRSANMYLLCASAYTLKDYKKFGLFRNRAFQWGYFPECKRYDSADSLMAGKDPCEILWCGRFLDWKHPDDALMVAKRLRDEGFRFHMSVIGTGEMQQELLTLSLREELDDDLVSFLGSMPPEEVRMRMERAGIYLFTSDHKEGWGAVLNEAMNSGCAVVACTAAGSTPCLIRHGENGVSYARGDTEALYRHVRYLLEHPEEQSCLGRAAYADMINMWNAEEAAKRLVALLERILEGDKNPKLYKNGPCSPVR